MKERLYIAYGSNLNTEQMAYRCPGAKPIAQTCLLDYRLVFQGRPGNAHANVIPEKGQKVPVVIWKISARDEASLDVYEGVRGGYYTKEYLDIEVGGEVKKALIYIMALHKFEAPAPHYWNVIAQGYRDFEFDTQPLDEALKHAYINAGRYKTY